jgi:hypothetical protein
VVTRFLGRRRRHALVLVVARRGVRCTTRLAVSAFDGIAQITTRERP